MAGGVADLVAGWLLGVRVAERSRGARARQVLARVIGVLGLVLLLPTTVATTAEVLYARSTMPATEPPPAIWGAYTYVALRPLALLGMTCLLLAVALTPWRRRIR